jgi:hypothetical protein
VARALRHAVVSRLARTLGRANKTMLNAIRVSALRREQNSHNAAEPRNRSRAQHNAVALARAKPAPKKRHCRRMHRIGSNTKDMALVHQLKLRHCVGCFGFQSVCWAAAVNSSAFSPRPWRRLTSVAGHGQQRGAGVTWSSAPKIAGPLWARCLRTVGTARPNTSLKLSSNGVPPGPGHRYGVHFLWPGPGVTPLAPA